MKISEAYATVRMLIELERDSGVQFFVRASVKAPEVPREPAAPLPAPEPVTLPPDLPPETALTQLAQGISACTRCGLCQGRKQTVPGEGHPRPELLFIGEGPGAEEDAQGRPFVGPAGQLLEKMIRAMGLSREAVYIANVVKCRPPGNRMPEPNEVDSCLPWLQAQVDVLKPKVICTLGNTPLRALSGDTSLGITRMRGQSFSWRGYTVLPTFHPSYLLRNESAKKPTWEDLKQVLALLGRSVPARG